MSEPLFFTPKSVLSLADIVGLTAAVPSSGSDPSRVFRTVAALDQAGPLAVAVCAGDADVALLPATGAGACFVTAAQAAALPPGTIALVTLGPVAAFSLVVAAFYPGVGRPASMFATRGINPGAFVHFEARLEADVVIDPGVVIGPRAEIGSGTMIGANSVVGPDVRIGRNCAIGAHVTIAHALIGNGVVIQPGVRIGQDQIVIVNVVTGEGVNGGGAIAGLGRVIIQDDVEIGANATIERGGLRDTIVGEGSRIGTLVAIPRDETLPRRSVLSRPIE